MKRFSALMALALLVVAVAAMSCITVVPAAAADQNVIYISDNGTGDGSSPSSPLKAETRVELDVSKECKCDTPISSSDAYKYYCTCFSSTGEYYSLNSVLYQAAEELAKTGGTIVLVGDVKIGLENTVATARYTNRDFFMPTYGQNKITIKGQGGRLVIEEGAMLNLGGDTVFENITIDFVSSPYEATSTKQSSAICAYGYDVVFEDTVTCTAEGAAYANQGMANFVSLVGGRRYGNFEGDTNLTVNGGVWNCIYGSNKGNNNHTQRGNIKVTINGGTIIGYVWGSSWDSTLHCGNADFIINGGTFKNQIYPYSTVGVGYKNSTVRFKINGGSFIKQALNLHNSINADSERVVPKVIYDLSDYNGSSDVNTLIHSSRTPQIVYYPDTMISYITLKEAPASDICYKGKEYDLTGTVLTVTYTNGKTAEIAYTLGDDDFAVSGNVNSAAGTVIDVGIAYGGRILSGYSKPVTIVEDPTPSVIGAQISTKNVNGGLRFVAEMQRSAEKFVSIKDYGFYIWDSTVLGAEKINDISKVQGIEQLTAYGSKFRAEYDELGIYNNDSKTTFSAVYDEVQINDYANDILAVAYVEYEYNGKSYTGYSNAVKKSVIGVANSAVKETSLESDAVKAWIKENIIDRYAEYSDDLNDKRLNEYDAANSDALREIVVSEMRANAEYAWTPSVDIDLTESVTVDTITYSQGSKYTAGTVYYGMPYVNNAKHELEEFASYVKTYGDGSRVYFGPVEGINDFGYIEDQAEYVEKNKYKLDEKYYEITSFFPASDFTGMIINVWNKVGSNKVWLTGLQSFIPGFSESGTLAVGDYDYSVSKSDTLAITQNNGEAVMYASYAQCKPGDVIICHKNGGYSIYMVMEAAGESSLRCMTFNSELAKSGDGQSHFAETEISFSNLYTNGYIPVTIPELATGAQSKTTAFVVGFDGEAVMKTGVLSGNLYSNKQIISVNVKLSRYGDAGEFYNETVYCNRAGDQNANEVELSQFNFADVLPYLVDGKEYTLTVNADIANEGVVTVVSYEYTEPTVVLSDIYSAYYDSFNADFSNITQTPIDHMKEQMNVYWTPATTFKYANLTGETGFYPTTEFKAGTVYRGILYANTRATLGDFVSVLGSKTWDSSLGQYVYTLGSGDSNYQGTTDWNYVMGNHCSASMYHGYQKVIRLRASSRGNPNMELLGLKDLYYGVSTYTNSVSKLYGAEAMYESYALAKPGDFMYRTAGGGHTRMVQDVHVDRYANGRINPNSSYILMIEQTNVLEKDPSGSFESTWWEHKYTFKALGTDQPESIILRPHEYMTNETEKHYVGVTKLASKSVLEKPNSFGYNLGVVESNYPIIAVRVTITEQGTGKILDRVEKRALTGVNSYNIGQLFNLSSKYSSTTDGYIYTGNYVGKSYTYTLEVELAIGKVVLQELKVSAS